MPRKRRVLQADRERPILTDLIPYEVPIRFSFLHIYRLLKDKSQQSDWLKRILSTSKGEDYDPFNYSLRLGERRSRCLSIIHPLLLRDFCELYADYAEVFVGLCSKSQWSLRRPSRVARSYYFPGGAPEEEDPKVPEEAEVEEDGNEPQTISSHFAYERYSFLERFFASDELLLLERGFSSYRRIDIARCFPNFYTHTISWAAKGKIAAKEEKRTKHTFDSFFDHLMRRSNCGETHGILIGAEVSRIFAEIILQEIDIRTQEELADILSEGSDFVVRRYIDDYFIFTNSDNTADQVEAAIAVNLAKYKLFLNDNKRENCTRPFLTAISRAKIALGKRLDTFFSCDHQAKTKKSLAALLLEEIRSLITDFDIKYEHVSAFVLKRIQRFALRSQKRDIPSAIRARWLKCVIEVCGHLVAVDTRFQTVIIFGRVLISSTRACDNLDRFDREDVRDSMLRGGGAVLNLFPDTAPSIELASLLICLRSIPEYWRIPASTVERAWLKLGQSGDADYFTIIAVIFFCGDREEYRTLREVIIQSGLARLAEAGDVKIQTEMFCLSLDFLSCPYIDGNTKRVVAARFALRLLGRVATDAELDQLVGETAKRNWFFDWREGVSTESYLKKKELSLGY